MCEDNVHKSQKNGQKVLLTEMWASSCHDIINKGYSEEECNCLPYVLIGQLKIHQYSHALPLLFE